jgi:basic membrane protein A
VGAIEACAEHGVHQIGNVRDWYPDYPKVFIASAVANVSIAALRAAEDLANDAWQPGRIVRIGLENPDAVALARAPTIPAEISAQIDVLATQILTGEIEVAEEYDGPEFELPPT